MGDPVAPLDLAPLPLQPIGGALDLLGIDQRRAQLMQQITALGKAHQRPHVADHPGQRRRQAHAFHPQRMMQSNRPTPGPAPRSIAVDARNTVRSPCPCRTERRAGHNGSRHGSNQARPRKPDDCVHRSCRHSCKPSASGPSEISAPRSKKSPRSKPVPEFLAHSRFSAVDQR
jgi:hypothetical protein